MRLCGHPCWPCGALALIASTCQPRYEGFSSRQIEIAESAAANVREDRVESALRDIYGAHLDDEEEDVAFDDSALGDICPEWGCDYNREAAAEVVRASWSELGTVREQRVSAGGLTTTNLFLDLPSARDSDEWVIAVAHYDAWYGGANDNASGVAVNMEAAFALASLELDRNVRFLLTDGEELGLVGTERYIAEYGVEGVVMVLNADSIAHLGTAGGWLTSEGDEVEYILQANEASAEAAYRAADLASRLPAPLMMRPVIYPMDGVSSAGFAVGYDLSDHAPFWLRDVRALFPFPAGGKPAWYHTPDDELRAVDSERLRRFGRFWAACIAAFATEEK